MFDGSDEIQGLSPHQQLLSKKAEHQKVKDASSEKITSHAFENPESLQ